MPGRRSKQRLTMRKSHRTTATSKYRQDEDGVTVLDDAKWKTLTPYGLCIINDDDGTTYQFKRGDVTTVLPRHKAPGEHIEPHEYWIGKILEIRADAESEDSRTIWAKVQWFYDAEEAASIVKSLDTSHIGRFERLLSSHWDFVLPQSFNAVVPMHVLRLYPFLKHERSRAKRLTLGMGRHVNAEKEAIVTTNTVAADGEFELEPGLEDQVPIEPDMFYWRYTIDIDRKKISPEPGLSSCLCSLPYSPDATSLLEGVMLFCPRQICRTPFHVGCLRDAKSVWVPDDQEVQHSPSKSSARGRNADRRRRNRNRQGKGKGKGKGVEKIEEKEVLTCVQWLTPRAMQRITCTPNSSDSLDLLSFFSPSPTINTPTFHKNHRRKSDFSTASPSSIISLLQRVYARQIQRHRGSSMTSERFSTHPVPTMSGGSWIEVEDPSVVAENDFDVDVSLQSDTSADDCICEDINDDSFVSENGNGNIGSSCLSRDATPQLAASKVVLKPRSKSKLRLQSQTTENEKSKQVQVESSFSPITTISYDKPLQMEPLTPVTLLATLFLLPSPFPPSYAAAISSQFTTSAPPSLTPNTSGNIVASTLPTSVVSPAKAAKSVPSPMDTSFDMAVDSKDLLLLASQPLIRGAEYIPNLGPTGNVNLVLAARRLIWKALSAIGRLELSSNASVTAPGLKERNQKSKARSNFEDGHIHQDERVFDEAQQDMCDAEDFLRVSECLLSVIGNWKERMTEDEKVLPPSVEVDDGIIIEEGLIDDDEFLSGVGKSDYVVVEEKKRKEDGDGDVEMDDGIAYEREMEEFGSLGSGKKRKRSDDVFKGGLRKKGKGEEKREEQNLTLEDILRVDWACPSCGNLL